MKDGVWLMADMIFAINHIVFRSILPSWRIQTHDCCSFGFLFIYRWHLIWFSWADTLQAFMNKSEYSLTKVTNLCKFSLLVIHQGFSRSHCTGVFLIIRMQITMPSWMERPCLALSRRAVWDHCLRSAQFFWMALDWYHEGLEGLFTLACR